MEEIEMRLERFLEPWRGGYGYGAWFSYRHDNNEGDGSGFGSGYGFDNSTGYGTGYCYGDDISSGRGDSIGCGHGYGNAVGGCRIDGSGFGDGVGTGISEFNGRKVYQIDDVATIIYAVHGNIARGSILNDNLTLTPCWVAKVGACFAHGVTPRRAVNDATAKMLKCSPIEERIAKFMEQWPDADMKIAARELWKWHHVLTGSCEAGRNAFVHNKGIDLDRDLFSVREFCRLTCHSYGSDAIQKLAEAYGIKMSVDRH